MKLLLLIHSGLAIHVLCNVYGEQSWGLIVFDMLVAGLIPYGRQSIVAVHLRSSPCIAIDVHHAFCGRVLHIELDSSVLELNLLIFD